MATPTPEEIDLLRTFRNKTADLGLKGPMNNDLYMLSWIRARDLDLTKAEAMLRQNVAWRKTHEIDTISSWTPPPEFEKELPFQITGFDKEGCPIAVLPFGRWDVRKFLEQGKHDNYLKYNTYLYAKLIESAQKTTDSFTQFVIVFDLEGYSFRQLTGKGCVDTALEITKRFEANYPERLKTAFLINAPKVFSILFSLIKPLLTARTLAKVQIFASNSAKWKLALLNNIPADQLPTKYGGTQSLGFNFLNLVAENETSNTADESIEVTVGAGDKLEVQYDVKHEGTTMSWRFQTDSYDIGFAIKLGSEQEVVKYARVESHDSEQVGSYVCSKTGTYTLLFDNTYSVVRPKQLNYMITLTLPDGVNDDEENTQL